MASSLIDKGTYMTLMLITINAFLFAGGAVVGQNNTDATQSKLFYFAPTGLNDANSDFSSSSDLVPVESSSVTGNETFLTVTQDIANSIFQFIKDLPTYAIDIIELIKQLLFAWAFVLSQLSIPFVIQWAMIIPLVFVEIITLAYWIITFLSALTGGLR